MKCGLFTGNCEREWKESSRNGASLFMGALLEEPGGVKEGSGDGHLSPWRLHWETWVRAHMLGGLCVEESSGMGVSPYRGPGEGGPSTRNFERWMKGALGMGHLSL